MNPRTKLQSNQRKEHQMPIKAGDRVPSATFKQLTANGFIMRINRLQVYETAAYGL
jgi:hypothetical protein